MEGIPQGGDPARTSNRPETYESDGDLKCVPELGFVYTAVYEPRSRDNLINFWHTNGRSLCPMMTVQGIRSSLRNLKILDD